VGSHGLPNFFVARYELILALECRQPLCCAVSPMGKQHENDHANAPDNHAAVEFIRGAADRSEPP
jgi:hypothetical protein